MEDYMGERKEKDNKNEVGESPQEKELRLKKIIEEKDQELIRWKNDYLTKQVENKLTEAALKLDADPNNLDIIIKYLKDYVRYNPDSGSFNVLESKGTNRFKISKSTATMMDVSEFVDSFLNERPSLKRASSTSTTGNKFNGRISLEQFRQKVAGMTTEEYAEYKKTPEYKQVLGG